MIQELREIFYARLAKDYKEEEERSFLYQYFVHNPPKRRGGAGERDIRRDIQTFLYDARHGRKADRSLALFLGYCESRGIDPFSGGGANGLDLDEVDVFYHDLRDGDNDGILLPIYIDSVTGAGLYIIGTAFLKELTFEVKGECCYGVLSPNFVELAKDEEKAEEDCYTWRLWFGDKSEAMEYLGFPSADEGFKWLRHKAVTDALEYFVGNNGDCPPSCPAALRRYFSPAKPQESEDMVAYGRRRFLEEMGES